MSNSETTEIGTDSVSFGGLIDDQEKDKRDDKKLANELRSFFNAVDRVVTMMRVYPFGHPLLDDLSNQLLASIQPILDRETSIVFNIDALELTTLAGTVVYSEELAEKNTFIWYAGYSDGLLQVRIEDGVNTDELVRFIRVIDRSARGDIESDDDTVTLLWEQNLIDIKYFAVEGFVDGGVLEDFGDRTEQDAIDMIVDAALEPDSSNAGDLLNMFDNLSIAHLDLFTKMQIIANARVIVPELRDDDLAYAFAVDEDLIQKLHDEWMAGTDLEYRLIEALLAIIRVAPGSAGARRAAAMITSVMRQLLDGQLYEQAVRVLELLKDRRDLFAGAEVDPLAELVEQLSEPMQVEALINLFQRNKEQKAMMRLFRLLGHVQVTKQVLNLFSDSKRKVVAIRQLVDLLFELYDEETDALFTLADFVGKPIYLRRLIGELSRRDISTWRPATRLIRKALEDETPEVRELVLALDHPCWSDPLLAKNHLEPMAADPNERVRKLALGLLGDKHPDLFRASIRGTIVARKVGDRTLGELRYLMRLLLKSEDGDKDLRELLAIRGWFGRDAIEYAKMAAIVLIEARDPQALATIDAKMKDFFTAPALKKAYAASLKRFKDNPIVEDDEAETDPDNSAEQPGPKPRARPAEAIEMPELDDEPQSEKKPEPKPESEPDEPKQPAKPAVANDDEDLDFDWDDDD